MPSLVWLGLHPMLRWRKDVEFFVCMFLRHACEIKLVNDGLVNDELENDAICAHIFALKALEYRNSFGTIQ